MQSKRSNSNAGFSLVELIVVVALMGVLIGGSLITYYTISSHNINKAKGFIEDSLNEGRSRAMTTEAKLWEVVITAEDVKVYKTDSDTSEVIDIQGNQLPGNVTVELQQSDSATVTYSLSEDGYDSIRISFKKLSGEVGKVSVVKGDTVTELYTSDEAKYCDIKLNYRDRTKTIRLYYATGKFVADE